MCARARACVGVGAEGEGGWREGRGDVVSSTGTVMTSADFRGSQNMMMEKTGGGGGRGGGEIANVYQD